MTEYQKTVALIAGTLLQGEALPVTYEEIDRAVLSATRIVLRALQGSSGNG